jgi:hypothetical protein
MTAPNLAVATSLVGKTNGTILSSTGITTCIQNSSGSNKVLKINSILAANVDGTSASDISVSFYDGSNDYYIVKTVTVPADATQIVLSKENYLYLEENVSIRAQASSANRIHILIGYEEIS